MPPRIGAVVSAGLATLAELSSVYGLEGLYDLLEIIAVDDHNRRAVEKHLNRK